MIYNLHATYIAEREKWRENAQVAVCRRWRKSYHHTAWNQWLCLLMVSCGRKKNPGRCLLKQHWSTTFANMFVERCLFFFGWNFPKWKSSFDDVAQSFKRKSILIYFTKNFYAEPLFLVKTKLRYLNLLFIFYSVNKKSFLKLTAIHKEWTRCYWHLCDALMKKRMTSQWLAAFRLSIALKRANFTSNE